MNRFTHAFSAALPSSASDASGSHPSPVESHFADPGHAHGVSFAENAGPAAAIYDDPRSTHHVPVIPISLSLSWGTTPALTLPKRPDLPRHLTDDGVGSGRATPRALKDPGVKANLMSVPQQWKKAWGGGNTSRLTAMAAGPDGKYAVGGAQYLKIVQVHTADSGSRTPTVEKPKQPTRVQQVLSRGPGGAQVSEVANLWKSGWAVGKGVNDIDWGVGAMENKLVTANPNGNFLVFDVVKTRYEREVSGGHPRPMNVLRFCKIPAYSHLLLTGGTDGVVKLWDMREREPTSRKSFKHSCPITSICFSPIDPDHFVVGLEQGGLHRYDLRSRQKSVGRIWGAHGNKAIMDLKWKASSDHDVHGLESATRAGWLASAGGDRKVRIWDMSQSWAEKTTPLHTIVTAHPLRRVSWRPGHDTEILTIPSSQPAASGSIDPTIASINSGLGTQVAVHEIDAHLEVWDVRRQYIAKYALPSSDGIAVDAVWSDEGSIVATFQDGAFSQLSMKGSELPLEQIPRQVVTWNAKGELAYAVDSFKRGEIPFDDLKPEYATHWEKVGRQSKSIADHAYEPLQALGVVPFPEDDEDEFVYLASHYKLEGKAPEQLCQWNREIAEICGRPDDARLWTFLKVLIEEFAPSTDGETFNEEIFSDPLPAAAQFPALAPSDVSPSDSHPSSRDDSPVRETRDVRVAPIPLERAPEALVDTSHDEVEELLSSAPSVSNSTDASATPFKGRFSAFLPPDVGKLSDSSNRPPAPTPAPTPAPALPSAPAPASTVPALPPSLGRRATVQTLFAQAVTQSQQAQNNPPNSQQPNNQQPNSQQPNSNHHSSGASSTEIDYPDPYGIGAATATGPGPMGVTSRRSSSDRPAARPNGSAGTDSRDRSGSETKSRASPLPGLHSQAQPNGPNRPSPGLAASNPTHSHAQTHTRAPRQRSRSRSRARAQSPSRSRSASGSHSRSPIAAAAISAAASVPAVVAGRKVVTVPVKDRARQFDPDEWEAYRRKRCQVLKDWWQTYVNDGNVQFSTVVFVVGSGIVDFPARQCERIATAYVDLLERRRSMAAAAYIRKHARIDSLQTQSNDEGVTHIVHCGQCGKATAGLEDIGDQGKRFCWCRRCALSAKRCAICHQGVKGIWVGCSRCKHGGHRQCMRLYYQEASVVPIEQEHDRRSNALRPLFEPIPSAAASTEGTSHDSSGFVDRARMSGEAAGEAEADGGGGRVSGYNVCPSGCGCRCRRVTAGSEGDPG